MSKLNNIRRCSQILVSRKFTTVAMIGFARLPSMHSTRHTISKVVKELRENNN